MSCRVTFRQILLLSTNKFFLLLLQTLQLLSSKALIRFSFLSKMDVENIRTGRSKK